MTATDRLDELRRNYAEHPRRYFAPLANELRKAGALDDAVALLRDELSRNPAHLSGHVVLGQTLFEAGALAEAGETFEQAVALDPGNLIVLRHLGEIARLRGDGDGAREWFSRLRSADPYADDVAVQLGGDEPPVRTGGVIEGSGPVMTPPVAHAAVTGAVAEPSEEPQRVDPVAFQLFEPIDFDPVVGLDAAPAEPLPEPIRDQLDDLFEAAPLGTPLDASAHASFVDDLGELAAAEVAASGAAHDATGDGAVGASGDLSERAAAASDSVDDVDRAVEDAPTPASGARTANVATPTAPFLTGTMAGLLVSQGHVAEALAIYEQLLAQRPDDEELRARVATLRGGEGAEARELAVGGVFTAGVSGGDPERDDRAASQDAGREDGGGEDAERSSAKHAEPANATQEHGAPEPPAGAILTAAADWDERASRELVEAPEEVGAPSEVGEPVAALATDGEDASGEAAPQDPAGAARALAGAVGTAEPTGSADAEVVQADDRRAAAVLRLAFATTDAVGDAPGAFAPADESVVADGNAPTSPEPDPFAELSFDRFFEGAEALPAPRMTPAGGMPAAATDPAPRVRPELTPDAAPAWSAPDSAAQRADESAIPPAIDDDEDLARFNAWLRGLAE